MLVPDTIVVAVIVVVIDAAIVVVGRSCECVCARVHLTALRSKLVMFKIESRFYAVATVHTETTSQTVLLCFFFLRLLLHSTIVIFGIFRFFYQSHTQHCLLGAVTVRITVDGICFVCLFLLFHISICFFSAIILCIFVLIRAANCAFIASVCVCECVRARNRGTKASLYVTSIGIVSDFN